MWLPLSLGLLLAGQEGEDRVISFKGLLQLEAEAGVPDLEKVAEWSAFVERTEAQLTYARKAVIRWRNAERERRLAEALALESNPEARPVDKEQAWLEVATTQTDASAVEKAQSRALHWHRVEARRLVEAAKAVEEEGALKEDRISAWRRVLQWARDESIRRAAQSRMRALQDRLVEEARSLDAVVRVDAESKIAAWRAVLAGAPTEAERAEARRRIKVLAKAE
ncbi:MAG: hypothetical protein AAGD10_16990 [Myxococcota bacterium]